MDLLAVTAREFGYWGDKLLYVILIAAALGAGSKLAGKRRRNDAQRMEDRDADRQADLQRSGPPRFNG